MRCGQRATQVTNYYTHVELLQRDPCQLGPCGVGVCVAVVSNDEPYTEHHSLVQILVPQDQADDERLPLAPELTDDAAVVGLQTVDVKKRDERDAVRDHRDFKQVADEGLELSRRGDLERVDG